MPEKFEGTTPPQESNEKVAREYDRDEIIEIFKDEFLKMNTMEIDSTVYDFLKHFGGRNIKITEKELRTKLVDTYNRNRRKS